MRSVIGIKVPGISVISLEIKPPVQLSAVAIFKFFSFNKSMSSRAIKFMLKEPDDFLKFILNLQKKYSYIVNLILQYVKLLLIIFYKRTIF